MKSGWPTKNLADVADSISTGPYGSMLHKSDYVPDGIPLVNPVNMVDARIVPSDKMMINEETRHRLSKYVLRAGDVVVARRGELGRCALVTENEDGWLCGTGSCFIRLSDQVDERFFVLLFGSSRFRELLEGSSVGTTMSNLNHGILKSLPVPVPPLHEQRRIVGILDEAFAGIATAKANAEKSLQNARALFESHLNAVFTQRGDGCAEKRLQDVCSFSSGGTPSKKNDSYWKGNIPWISGRDMKSTQLSDSALHISQKAVDESSTRMAPAGSLLTLVRGMGLAHGAQIAELMVPCAFNQDIRAIHPDPDIVPRYLLFALKTRINTSDNVMSNAAHGTMKIDMDELKNVPIPVPSPEHQDRIVRQIGSLSEATQRLESIYQRKLDALDELKKSLLHQAFSGKLPRTAEDEPSETMIS
ncbi:MAG: restriction endonuclease subunit S [Pirellulaceae bacterium]|nr:restriction endonuclease subunit S [Pirellulaceae bacterium]